VEEEVDAGREQQNATNDPFGGDQAKDAAAAGLIVGFRHSEKQSRTSGDIAARWPNPRSATLTAWVTEAVAG
jgi:hypothetical protein